MAAHAKVTTTDSVAPAAIDVPGVQRRTLRLLVCTQIVGGVGVAIGISVGALLAAEMAGTRASGFAGSAAVVGAALLAIPATRLMRTGGRRPALAFAYLIGAVGALVVVMGAALGLVPLLFLGIFLFGGGTTANLLARYAAVDLADPARRARQLSLVVWATTVGAVAGPNLAPVTDGAVAELGLGLREYAGPYLFSAVAFGTAAVAIVALLRPDPLLTARTLAARETGAAGEPPAAVTHRGVWRRAARVVAGIPGARLGMAAVAVGHLVMVAVMVMTPVHLGESHSHADVLRIVGIVLSLHIAGMFALSPVVGLLADRLGRRPVILGGVGLLLAACAIAGTAGHDTARLAIGLALLGLGWSGTMVAGSTLLSESVPVDDRPAAQSLSDLMMGLAGAAAGAVSGFVVDLSGYPTLNLLAAIATVPLVALALRPVRVALSSSREV
ncbi:MAG TPA: MFS transporter [Pilimelia sp.]|nr:MFS transporter [Pilimelia sp.]